MRSLYIQTQFDPPISGCADGVTADEIFTAILSSNQIEELIHKINETVKTFHTERGLAWED